MLIVREILGSEEQQKIQFSECRIRFLAKTITNPNVLSVTKIVLILNWSCININDQRINPYNW